MINKEMDAMNFNQIHTNRKMFISKNRDKDHCIIYGNNSILFSAPHGVTQVRLGKPKYCEIGSLATALCLQQITHSHLIAKTKNNFDDANFDDVSPYKNSVLKLIQKNNIKYLLDFHGLSSKREIDVNLGTNLGNNIKNNESIFNQLYQSLVSNGFTVSVDQPFMAGGRTISGFAVAQCPKLWAIQIEINCSITNEPKNFDRFKKLISILTDWLNLLN